MEHLATITGFRTTTERTNADAGGPRGQRVASYWPAALGITALAVALLLWALALTRTEVRAMSGLGLVSVLPPEYYAALAVLVVSFSVLVFRARLPLLLGAHVVALVLFLHATPAILYGTLRYSWAWKHLGVIDYIQRHGGVDPTSAFLTPYHNWPGFFAWGAFLGDLAGPIDMYAVANWAPVYFNLLNLGAVALIVMAFTRDRRLLWLALWLFLLGNWVGQDYFAPQAVGFFLYLVVAGIVLTWFGRRIMAMPRAARRTVRGGDGRSTAPFQAQAAPADGGIGLALGEQGRAARLWLLTIVFVSLAALAYTHQLTPMVAVLALAALMMFGRLTAPSLPVLFAVMTVTWMFYGATHFVAGNLAGVVAWVGQLGETLDSNIVDVAVASPEQQVVSAFSRGLSLAMVLLAGVGLLRRYRNGYWDLAAVLMLAAAWALLPLTSYGGELFLRIYLFSTPFLAFLAAALVFPSPRRGTSPAAAVGVACLSIVLLSGFLVSYYGKDHQYYFTPQEVEASEYLYSTAPEGSLLVEGSKNYPGQHMNYEHFTYVAIAREPAESRERIIANPVDNLFRWMSDPEYTSAYIVITRSQKIENAMNRVMPLDALTNIEAKLEASPLFEVAFSNEDATIFTLAVQEEGTE